MAAGRKIDNEIDARGCLLAAARSGRRTADWARAHGIDGRSSSRSQSSTSGSELLAVAQRKQRKPAPDKPPAAPPPLDAEARRTFEDRPKAPEKPAAEPTSKGKVKPTGRKAIPSHLEADEHTLRPDHCAGCGGTALDVVDEIREEKLHVVKEHQRRRVVHRFTCRCRACGQRTTLRSLAAPYERSKVTCEWLAWLVYQKLWLLTPLDRIRRDSPSAACPSR